MLQKCNNPMIRVLVVLGWVVLPSYACRCQGAQNMLGATTPVSYAPLADPQQITINSTNAVPLVLTGYDANGIPLSFAIGDPPSRGVLGSVDTSTGKVTYTPPADLSGSDSFTFTVTSGVMTSQPATVTIQLVPPGFALTNGGGITEFAGSSGTSALTVTPSAGFTGQVSFGCAVSGSPTGLTCSAPFANVTGASAATSTLTVATTAATPLGNYTATVTASDAATGKINSSTLVSITVNAAPSFALSALPTAVSVAQGNISTTTITVTDVGGFSGAVSLSATGLPNGVTYSVAPGSGAGTQVLTLMASASAAVTSNPVTVTISGTSGALTVTTSIALTITGQASFTSGPGGTATMTLTRGGSGTATISVVGTNGFAGTVNLSCNISPTVSVEPTCSLNPTSVQISGTGAQTSTLTVGTTAASSAVNKMKTLFWPSAGAATFALVLCFAFPNRRRDWLALLVLAALIASIGVAGCGGNKGGGNNGGGGNSGTTSGTYTITVTGTSGTISATVGTVSLTVQ